MAAADSSSFGRNPAAGLSATRFRVVGPGAGRDHDHGDAPRQAPGEVKAVLVTERDVHEHDIRA